MLTCEQAEPELSAYLDGELTAQERSTLDAHLVLCEKCNAALTLLEQTQKTLTALPKIPAPIGLAAKIKTAVSQTPQNTVEPVKSIASNVALVAVPSPAELPTAQPEIAVSNVTQLDFIEPTRMKFSWSGFGAVSAALLMLCLMGYVISLPYAAKFDTVFPEKIRAQAQGTINKTELPAPEKLPERVTPVEPVRKDTVPADQNAMELERLRKALQEETQRHENEMRMIREKEERLRKLEQDILTHKIEKEPHAGVSVPPTAEIPLPPEKKNTIPESTTILEAPPALPRVDAPQNPREKALLNPPPSTEIPNTRAVQSSAMKESEAARKAALPEVQPAKPKAVTVVIRTPDVGSTMLLVDGIAKSNLAQLQFIDIALEKSGDAKGLQKAASIITSLRRRSALLAQLYSLQSNPVSSVKDPPPLELPPSNLRNDLDEKTVIRVEIYQQK